jgi:hypothetical protein
MSQYNSVSPELQKKICDMYVSGEGKQSIVESTGISPYKLYKVLEYHDIPRRRRGSRSKSRRYRWTDSQLREMCAARDHLGVSAVESRYGIDKTTLWRHCKRLGFGSKALKKPWLTRFFSGTGSSVAYWAGFLMADGCITQIGERQYQITLGITASDRHHIQAFRKAVGSKHQICSVPGRQSSDPSGRFKSKPSVRLYLSGDQALADDLRRWGVVPRKSSEANWVEPTVRQQDLRHFLRGWFDGDGSIGFRKQHFLQVVGHRTAMKWFASQMHFSLGCEGRPYLSKARGCVTMRYSGRWNVLDAASSLYKRGDICLARKWDISDGEDWKEWC